MTSNDVQYVTGEMFKAGIGELKAEILALDRKVELVSERVLGINERIDDIKFYVSVVFGVLAVVVALAALFPAITTIARSLRRSVPSEEKMQAMIDDAVARALSKK